MSAVTIGLDLATTVSILGSRVASANPTLLKIVDGHLSPELHHTRDTTSSGAKNVQHPVKKAPVVVCRACLPPALGRKQPTDNLPLCVAQIASRQQHLLAKGGLESARATFGISLCQQSPGLEFAVGVQGNPRIVSASC